MSSALKKPWLKKSLLAAVEVHLDSVSEWAKRCRGERPVLNDLEFEGGRVQIIEFIKSNDDSIRVTASDGAVLLRAVISRDALENLYENSTVDNLYQCLGSIVTLKKCRFVHVDLPGRIYYYLTVDELSYWGGEKNTIIGDPVNLNNDEDFVLKLQSIKDSVSGVHNGAPYPKDVLRFLPYPPALLFVSYILHIPYALPFTLSVSPSFTARAFSSKKKTHHRCHTAQSTAVSPVRERKKKKIPAPQPVPIESPETVPAKKRGRPKASASSTSSGSSIVEPETKEPAPKRQRKVQDQREQNQPPQMQGESSSSSSTLSATPLSTPYNVTRETNSQSRKIKASISMNLDTAPMRHFGWGSFQLMDQACKIPSYQILPTDMHIPPPEAPIGYVSADLFKDPTDNPQRLELQQNQQPTFKAIPNLNNDTFVDDDTLFLRQHFHEFESDFGTDPRNNHNDSSSSAQQVQEENGGDVDLPVIDRASSQTPEKEGIPAYEEIPDDEDNDGEEELESGNMLPFTQAISSSTPSSPVTRRQIKSVIERPSSRQTTACSVVEVVIPVGDAKRMKKSRVRMADVCLEETSVFERQTSVVAQEKLMDGVQDDIRGITTQPLTPMEVEKLGEEDERQEGGSSSNAYEVVQDSEDEEHEDGNEIEKGKPQQGAMPTTAQSLFGNQHVSGDDQRNALGSLHHQGTLTTDPAYEELVDSDDEDEMIVVQETEMQVDPVSGPLHEKSIMEPEEEETNELETYQTQHHDMITQQFDNDEEKINKGAEVNVGEECQETEYAVPSQKSHEGQEQPHQQPQEEENKSTQMSIDSNLNDHSESDILIPSSPLTTTPAAQHRSASVHPTQSESGGWTGIDSSGKVLVNHQPLTESSQIHVLEFASSGNFLLSSPLLNPVGAGGVDGLMSQVMESIEELEEDQEEGEARVDELAESRQGTPLRKPLGLFSGQGEEPRLEATPERKSMELVVPDSCTKNEQEFVVTTLGEMEEVEREMDINEKKRDDIEETVFPPNQHDFTLNGIKVFNSRSVPPESVQLKGIIAMAFRRFCE
ncbi:UNVERIFIED_CONTAM: hypothetical protein HDU68_002327 [Siphonaria sp. JEL0065]|nr:hypothetical protein HDU68_002327 [Siphonaria sp. JEL0065]